MSEFNFNRLQGETKFRQLVRISVAKLNKEHSMDWLDVKEMFDFQHSAESLRKYASGWKLLLENEEIEQLNSEEKVTYKETTEILSDGSHRSDKLVRMTAEQSKNVDYLLEAHGFNKNTWELVNAKNNIWNVYSKQDGIQSLYSSRVTVKPKIKEFSIDDIKDAIRDLMENYEAPILKPIKFSSNGKLLEVNVSDLHLNKLGYIDGEYDHELAEKAFFHILNTVVNQTEHLKFEKILFIWSHDFFNVDGLTKTTTNGTPQDVSTRFASMYKQGKRMLIQGIDLLKQIAPVETIQVGANHDRLTSYTMSEVLEAWYRNDESVTIDNDPLSRKYRRFGKCLIGFSHGDKEKKRLGKIMPVEARKDWGETLYAEIHAGHFHSEQAVKEENGIIVRYLSSPSGTDNWHYESGYVGAIKKAQSFVWDKDKGLELMINTTVTEDELTYIN
ncbi:hypothetical protein KDN24_06250 [Bacillus sp. Bva_UNVM-123]|uniref:hypothetical protein n=1 Tax=Bacillus sp. Bva_UNVM-123 TaxID=2829798 RepID=UPI00391F38EC